jgi:hypothetical protein
MNLWDKTIVQAELTLNLMRGSRMNPKLLAWEQIIGRFNFNATPIAPPGIKVLAHLKVDQRASHGPHTLSQQGTSDRPSNTTDVSPSMPPRHAWNELSTQILWFPPKPSPKLTSADLLRATVEDLKTILSSPPTETYVGQMEQTQLGELISLCDTIQDCTQAKYPAPKLGVPQESNPAPELGVAPTNEPRRSTRTPSVPTPGDAYLSYNSDDLHLASTTLYQVYQHHAFPAINPDTGQPAEYKILVRSSAEPRWSLAMCKELGRLFQGFISKFKAHTVQGTLTCCFIHPDEIPEGKRATYIRITAEYREQKADPYRVRCTVGGNLIDFPGDKSTKTAELTTIKCLLKQQHHLHTRRQSRMH